MGFLTNRKIAREDRRTGRRTERAEAGAGGVLASGAEQRKQRVQELADPNFGKADEAAIRQDQGAAADAAFAAMQGTQQGTPAGAMATDPGAQAEMMRAGANTGAAASAMAAPTARALQNQLASDYAAGITAQYAVDQARIDGKIEKWTGMLLEGVKAGVTGGASTGTSLMEEAVPV